MEYEKTDLDMPVMDGWILSRRIKQLSPNKPILMITGDTSAEKTRAAKHAYVDLIIHKPFSVETLKQAVDQLLNFGYVHQMVKKGNAISAFNNVYKIQECF